MSLAKWFEYGEYEFVSTKENELDKISQLLNENKRLLNMLLLRLNIENVT